MTQFINGRIDQRMLQVVVNIEKPDGSGGTGFLVSKNREIFLITNKHMIGSWSLIDPFAILNFVTVTFYPNDQGACISQRINLRDINGIILSNVHCHPNDDVDVVAIEITDIFNSNYKISVNHLGYGALVPIKDVQKETYLGYGSQVFALGYPRGLKLASSNFPIAKSGYIASPMSGNLEIMTDFKKNGNQIVPKKLSTKFFLLDGLIMGGNSGGPVISPIDFYHSVNQNGGLDITQSGANLVIGIVSFGWESKGVTVVYPSDYILDLL